MSETTWDKKQRLKKQRLRKERTEHLQAKRKEKVPNHNAEYYRIMSINQLISSLEEDNIEGYDQRSYALNQVIENGFELSPALYEEHARYKRHNEILERHPVLY